MSQSTDYSDDEIDLKEVIFNLVHGWKTILLLTVIGGVLGGMLAFAYSRSQVPAYTATAQIYADPRIFSPASAAANADPGINMINRTLGNDMVRQKTAEALNLDVNTIPLIDSPLISNMDIQSVTFVMNKADTSLYNLTVLGSNAELTSKLANAWADAGVAALLETAQIPFMMETQTKTAQGEAQAALLAYLDKQNLAKLTWADLEILTGISLASTIMVSGNSDLQQIPSPVRLEISKLMQTKLDADAAYAQARSQTVQINYNLTLKPPQVFQRAIVPTQSEQSGINTKTIFALGAVAGLISGVFWLFAAAWWRQGENNKLFSTKNLQ
ncbi:MAG: Wzz/FepE/Etk N-terminal domain-containing protein [Chloroflexota bacterium]